MQAASPNEEVANFNRRDRGILLYLMQRYREATEELQLYLKVQMSMAVFAVIFWIELSALRFVV